MADLGSIGAEIASDMSAISILSIRVHHGATPYTVSGVIYDDTSTECARTVRLYRRSDGVLLGETTSDAGDGTYELDATADEVYRVVLDDSAGTLYNDLIDRVLPGLSVLIGATGMATSTNTALALSRVSIRATDTSTETDTALAL